MPFTFALRSSISSSSLLADTLTDGSMSSPSYTHMTTPASSRASISSASSGTDARGRNSSVYFIDSLLSSHSLDKHSSAATTMSIAIESPPLVFYGGASTSTGALLSGQLKLDVATEELEVDSFTMRLTVDATMKKPFHANCRDCTTQTSDLTSWTFLHSTTVLNRGEHYFPFSFLLPGDYQTCMHGSLSIVTYSLRALLTPKHSPPLTLLHPLDVRRAIRPPEDPRHYIRDFPPTSLSAHITLPALLHPTGPFPATLSLSGTRSRDATGKTTTWELKRVSWRLEETQKVVAPACPKHAPKSGSVKGILRSVTHTLTSAELTTGWTTSSGDDNDDTTITHTFPFGPSPTSPPAICTVKTEDGTETQHTLVVELLVASALGTRLLRMRLGVHVTERGGAGVAWDEEAPPGYGEAGGGPPGYVGGEVPAYEDVVRESGEGGERVVEGVVGCVRC